MYYEIYVLKNLFLHKAQRYFDGQSFFWKKKTSENENYKDL